jgi:hypothetical protein
LFVCLSVGLLHSLALGEQPRQERPRVPRPDAFGPEVLDAKEGAEEPCDAHPQALPRVLPRQGRHARERAARCAVAGAARRPLGVSHRRPVRRMAEYSCGSTDWVLLCEYWLSTDWVLTVLFRTVRLVCSRVAGFTHSPTAVSTELPVLPTVWSLTHCAFIPTLNKLCSVGTETALWESQSLGLHSNL